MRGWVLLFLVSMCCGAVAAATETDYRVSDTREEGYRDSDFAVAVPQRLELVCRTSTDGPWGFAFAGMLLHTRSPLEFEITGQGPYNTHDIYSIAGLSLDYGKPDGGWSERSFFGLGLIQPSRDSHPPSWGVGSPGKFVMRGNLINATTEPQRLRIDSAKYAPPDWDGRLWIGALLHNVGPGRSLRVRLVVPGTPTLPAMSEEQLRATIRVHQKEKLEQALQEVEHTGKALNLSTAPAELRSFAEKLRKPEIADALRRAIADVTARAMGAEAFTALSGRAASYGAAQVTTHLDAIARLHAKWRADGGFGREIGCIVRHASNLEKIGLTDVTGGRILGAAPQPIRLTAARHEYEGFQLVLTPLEGIAGRSRQLAVAVSDLRGSTQTLSHARFKVNAAGYVRIFPGLAREALVPDPLLEGTIPELAAGENQPVWITLYVPPDAAPGKYAGEVTITDRQSGAAVRVPLELHVRSFEIPKRISLRSSFWMFRDQLNRFYHVDEVKLDDYLKWIDFALEHRLCPIDVYEGHCRQLVDVINETTPPQIALHMELKGEGTPNAKPDFTNWDRYLDHMIAGGANTLPLGQSHHHGGWFTTPGVTRGSAEQIRRLTDSLKVLRDHYKSRGVFDMHYMQLRDETSEQDSLNVYREVSRQMPELKLLLTVPSNEARPFVRIPCPQSAGFDAAWRDEAKAKGGEYWWYVCLAPNDPYANFFLYQSAPQHRALFWQTWDRKVEGLLYWGLNFWSWYKEKWPAGAKGPSQRVQPAGGSNFCSIPEYPGDGFMIYPGATPDKPLSSIRLEVMRDGEEDFEYFLLLDKLLDKAKAAGRDDAAVQRARSARASASALVADLTRYERDGARYLQVRDEIADSIEALLR